MNIIFLDVDGVLNSIRSLREAQSKNKQSYSCYNYPFDLTCLDNLSYLVRETNSYIVITSTWRMAEKGKEVLLSKLKEYDLDNRVIGYTKVLQKERGEEIKEYLSRLDGNINFIIIDDDNDFKGLEEFLIKTNREIGLSSEDANIGIKKLLKI